jgi:hypothetical protein
MKDFENVVVPEELQQLHQTMVTASSKPVARQAALAILKEYYRYGKSKAIFTKALDSDEIILSYQFNLLVMDSICVLTDINNT